MGTFCLPDFSREIPLDERALRTVRLLASGGDERITLDPASGLNRYHSGPYPRTVTAYASSVVSQFEF